MNYTQNVLVTGGSGFIGGYVAQRLRDQGHVVTIFDLEQPRDIGLTGVRVVLGDLTDRDAVFTVMEGKDAVFHYGGVLGTHETVENAHETARVNILGAINVFDAALEEGAVVYDVTKPNYWRNPYTITKVAAEEFALMYRDEFDLPVVLLRYFNVYGPRQRTDIYQKAVPTFIECSLKGEPLPVFGDGRQGTDHIFVEDAARATVRLFESGFRPEPAVEIGSGAEVSVLELANLILELTGSSSTIKHLPMRRGEDPGTSLRADTGFIRDKLRLFPKYSLEDGLKKTIDWYRERLEETGAI